MRSIPPIRAWLSLALVCIQLGAGVGQGRAEAPEGEAAAASERAARPARAPTAYMRAIERAVRAYGEERFVEARAQFEQAHALRQSARTWRGLGATAFELGRDEDAIRELTEALRDTRAPLTPPLRAATEQMLGEARARLAQRRAEEGEPPSAEPARGRSVAPATEAEPSPAIEARPPLSSAARREQPSRGPLRRLTITASVIGAAGVIAGAAFGGRSMRQGRLRDRDCDEGGGCASPRGKRAGDAAILAGDLSTASWIVGGVGLSTALVAWTFERARGKRPAVDLSWTPRQVQLRGSW